MTSKKTREARKQYVRSAIITELKRSPCSLTPRQIASKHNEKALRNCDVISTRGVSIHIITM